MQAEYPYKSLQHTLQCLKDQVIDSLPTIHKYIPGNISCPEDLFYFLKSVTKYKNDPKNVELLQCVQTLMENSGRGDCDCFTILVLASCHYLEFDLEENQQVVLAGNTKKSPSHIYSMVWDEGRNRMCSMDLTNPYYDTQRSYAYKQTLDFMMTLRLADNGEYVQLSGKARKERVAQRKEAKKERQQVRQDKKLVKVQGKKAVREAKVRKKVNVQHAREDQRVGVKKLRLNKKIDKHEMKQPSISPDSGITTPEDGSSSAIPVSPSFSPASGGGGGYNPMPAQQYDDSDQDDQDDDVEEVEAEEFEYAEDPYSTMNDPYNLAAGGIWGTAFTAAKGAIKGAVNQVTSQAKGAVKQVNPSSLQKENDALKAELQALKDSQPLRMGGSALAGSVAGFLIGKLLK